MTSISQDKLDGILSHVAYNNSGDVRELLRRNGIVMGDQLKQNELTVVFLKAIKDSDAFRQDLSDYLTGMVQFETQNFVSQYPEFYNMIPIEDTQPASTTTTTPTTKEKTAFGSALTGLVSGDNLSNLFNTGLNVLSTSLTNKANAQSEQRALEAKALDLQIKNAELEKARLEGTSKKGMSTGVVILIILGVVGVGILIWFLATRKK